MHMSKSMNFNGHKKTPVICLDLYDWLIDWFYLLYSRGLPEKLEAYLAGNHESHSYNFYHPLPFSVLYVLNTDIQSNVSPVIP